MGYPPPINGPAPPFPFGPDDNLAAYEEGLAVAQAAEAAAAAATQATAKAAGQRAYDQSIQASAAALSALTAATAAANAAVASTATAALGVARTLIAAGSNGATLPQAIIYVADPSAFPSTGSFTVDGSTVQYTGKTSGAFTGCTGGTATMHENDLVTSIRPDLEAEAAEALAIATALNTALAQANSAAVAAATAAGNAAAAKATATGGSGASPLSMACKLLESGVTFGLGGDTVSGGLSASPPAETLSAGASAGVSATCCGFSLNLSFGFAIDFQIPSLSAALLFELLIPYLGFSLSCDPTQPVNLALGIPYGGGRVSNAEPDPDLDEENC